jgi:hypothetical protein
MSKRLEAHPNLSLIAVPSLHRVLNNRQDRGFDVLRESVPSGVNGRFGKIAG